MRDRKLHLPRGFCVPVSVAIQTVQDVFILSIRERWESLLRVAATIDEGWTSATQLLERFGSAARGEEVYRAGAALGRNQAELGVISGALTLVTNAVMTWNAARLQKAVDSELAIGTERAISVDALSHIGPVAHAHINFRGSYRFPVERYAARLLRPAA